MKRLINQAKNTKNSAQEYDCIFYETKPDWVNRRRWKILLEKYHGGNLLDVGCLWSEISQMKKEKGNYLGIDLSIGTVLEMNRRYGKEDCHFAVADIYDLRLAKESFDYIILGEILEHLDHPFKAIFEAYRVLKIGGIMAISVPNNEAIEPGAVDLDRHVWSFDKPDMKSFAQRLNGKLLKTKIKGSVYFPKYYYYFPTLFAWIKKR